jgi:hypothetical protein
MHNERQWTIADQFSSIGTSMTVMSSPALLVRPGSDETARLLAGTLDLG